MISKENKRVPVTISKEEYDYFKRIVNIYNTEVSKDENRLINKNYKISISGMFKMAVQNMILNIDKQFDLQKSKEENYKAVYLYLGGK